MADSILDGAGRSLSLRRSIGDESHIYAGRVWIAPDGASQAQIDAMGRTVGLPSRAVAKL